MICSKFKIVLVLPLIILSCLAGCQAQEDEQSVAHNAHPETAKIIRQLAAAAAGISDADFTKLARSGSTPNPVLVSSQPLSLVVMCHAVMRLPEEVVKERDAEFKFSSFTPNPNKLVDLLRPTPTVDCWTMLHPKYITDVTCDVENDTATGVISFDAEHCAGHVHYVASKEDKNWQINEFSFPVRDWRFVRGEDGNWQWHDHFGHKTKDRQLPMQNLAGQVLLDDKPIQVGQIGFTMRSWPEFSFYSPKTGSKGNFKVSLPAGKYIVTCSSRELSDRFSDRSKSDLIVDIEAGQTELLLKLDSTPDDQAEVDVKLEAQAKHLVASLKKKLASGPKGIHFFGDFKTLTNMDVPESSRVAATDILKTALSSEFGLNTESMHRMAIGGLLKWASVEDQSSIFVNYYSSRSRKLVDQYAENVYSSIVKAGTERGLKLVIRRVKRSDNIDADPAAQALIKGGTKCEDALIAAAESSTSTLRKILPVLERIGTSKSVAVLKKLEQESKDDDDRNKIGNARLVIQKRIEKTAPK